MRDGNFEIYVMDTDGGNVRRLTDNSAADKWPVWSPAGRTSPGTVFSLEDSERSFDPAETFQAGLGDLDGDGDIDLIVGSLMGSASILPWMSEGPKAATRSVICLAVRKRVQ